AGCRRRSPRRDLAAAAGLAGGADHDLCEPRPRRADHARRRHPGLPARADQRPPGRHGDDARRDRALLRRGSGRVAERMSVGRDTVQPTPSATALHTVRGGLARLGGDRIIFGAAWIAMVVFFTIKLPGTYLTMPNVSTMLASQAYILILALATLLP